MIKKSTDEENIYFMQLALKEAKKAQAAGEIPVGAVLVYQNTCIAKGHNESILSHDPSAHAEIVVLRRAGEIMQNYRFLNCRLYVTLEPCAMCTGALIHARISEVIYGTSDPKTGACGSQLCLHENPIFNHRFKITSGILGSECSLLLTEFFKNKRLKT